MESDRLRKGKWVNIHSSVHSAENIFILSPNFIPGIEDAEDTQINGSYSLFKDPQNLESQGEDR